MNSFLLFLTLILASVAVGAQKPTDLRVFHATTAASSSWVDFVLQMRSSDSARFQYLSSLAAARSDVPLASARAVMKNPTYVVKINVGTPPQNLFAAFHTSVDAAWIPCSGCSGCTSATFDKSKSSTFKTVACGTSECAKVPHPSCSGGGAVCGTNLTYGNSVISATAVQDTVSLSSDPIPAYTFGCVHKANGTSFPAQGLIGLGRGPLSLISQTVDLYKSTFSYCLPGYKSVNFTGSLRLGPVAQPKRIKTTPLLRNQRRSSLYYVELVGIRVGGRVVNVNPSALRFDPISGNGTVLDSGTMFTTLVKPAYTAVRDELRRRMGNATVSSLGGFDTCYTVPIVVPTLTFMFSGMNVTLPQDNFIIRSTAGTTSCLAMAASAEGLDSGLNVIASFQQQNHRILIDGPNSRLGVARELCS